MGTRAEKLWNDANAGDEASLNTDLIGINATDLSFQKVGPMGWDCTALAVAAFRGHDDIVRKLIQAGAKADMQDKKGKTALHYADEAMKFMCVIALLGAGASPFIKDKEGKSAMEADGVMMTLVKALIDSNNEEPPKECYQVVCPVRTELSGVYEFTQEEAFQQQGGPYVLTRNPQDSLWCINNGDFFLVTSFDTAADPSLVQYWKVRVEKKFVRCAEMRVFKPSVHKGVRCDECKTKPILGVRFKCVGRDDYDLCAACEAKKTQPFPTLKVYVNEQRPDSFEYTCASNSDITIMPTNSLPANTPHPGTACSGCRASPIVGPRFLCTVRAGYNLCAACEAGTQQMGLQPHAMLKICDPKHAPSRVVYTAEEETPMPPASSRSTATSSSASTAPPTPSAPTTASGTASSAKAQTPPAPPPTTGESANTSSAGKGAAPPTPPTSQASTARPSASTFAHNGKPTYRITCPDLPEADGVYEQEFEDQYTARGGSNTLIKHPMDNVWCVSNGSFFVLMATDTAADPSAVKGWKIRVKNKLVANSTVVVTRL